MTRKRESLGEFTERAIRATDAGHLIPPIVYLPRGLRAHKTRLTVDQVRVTVAAPTVAENHVRILDADPLGFLIAIMHGQPIPSFHITGDGAIRIEYEVPDMERREKVAKFLAHKVTIRTRTERPGDDIPESDEWDDLVQRREEGKRNATTAP